MHNVLCFRLFSMLIEAFRYFFHATHHRTEMEEYEFDDEVDAPMTNSTDAEFKVPDISEDKEEESDAGQIDPSIADWFKVEQDQKSSSIRVHEDSDTETEDDSDHDDLRPEEEDDEWHKVESNPDVASGSDYEKVRQGSG